MILGLRTAIDPIAELGPLAGIVNSQRDRCPGAC